MSHEVCVVVAVFCIASLMLSGRAAVLEADHAVLDEVIRHPDPGCYPTEPTRVRALHGLKLC